MKTMNSLTAILICATGLAAGKAHAANPNPEATVQVATCVVVQSAYTKENFAKYLVSAIDALDRATNKGVYNRKIVDGVPPVLTLCSIGGDGLTGNLQSRTCNSEWIDYVGRTQVLSEFMQDTTGSRRFDNLENRTNGQMGKQFPFEVCLRKSIK